MAKRCQERLRFATFAQVPRPFNDLWRNIIATHDPASAGRTQDLSRWLAKFDGLANVDLEPASGDASFRRYFRLRRDGGTFIVMDAPPPHENCRPFVTLAGYLESMGINAPQVLGADFAKGFVLMTDLGPTQYLDALREDPGRADALYADAVEALLRMQTNGVAYQQHLPEYDAPFVERELAIFREWLCERHLGIEFSASEQKAWQECCAGLIANATQQERVFMHRDYHSRNLMLTGQANPGVLDFQDAVEGPLTYDAVSLFRDCYIEWPAERVSAWALDYFARLDDAYKRDLDADRFLVQFDLMGMQRHLKAAGIFARLRHRDGKDGYLADIPRTLGYVSSVAAGHGGFEFLADLIDRRVLPALQEQG